MNTQSRNLKCFAGLMIALGLCVTGLHANISARARTSQTTIELGQSIVVYSDAVASNGDLVALSGYLRGPGSYTAPDWTGWWQNISVGFGGRYSASTSTTYTPPSTGTYQFHANGYSSSDGWAGTDIGNWASWNTYSGVPAIAATFTVVSSSTPIMARARASAKRITLGETITFYSDATASGGNLVALVGYVRGPGSYTAPDWTGWSQILSTGFSATGAASASTTYTPTTVGTYQYHANGYSSGSGWAGTSINSWASWDTYSATPAIAANFTVIPNSYTTPSYQPNYWNDAGTIQYGNNCYNYANNRRTDTYAQPGRADGMYPSVGATETSMGAIADGLEPTTSSGTSASGKTLIALVIAPGWDYHWYRRDSNGYWTHKPAWTPATDLDNSGNPITDPETADRGPYTQFVGYFFTPSDSTQGNGYANIN